MSLSLKLRLTLSVVFTTAVVLLYAMLALQGQRTASLLVREALSKDVAAMNLASEIKHAFVMQDDLTFRFLSTGDETLIHEGARMRGVARSAMARLESESDSPTVRELLAELGEESAVYFKDIEGLLKTAPGGVAPDEKVTFFKALGWARRVTANQKTLSALSARQRTRLTLVYSLCDKLVDLHRVRIEEAQKRIREALDRSERTIRWGGSCAFAGIALAGALLALSLLAPLRRLRAGIDRILGGDLDFEIPPSGADEVGAITRAFNAMTRRLRENQRRLLQETITDALTGLFNFRHFQETLKVETERARRYVKPLSILIVDIDHFKAYNDAHGHETGNLALKGTAQALREALRPSDFLARYGGEEFVILLPETDQTQALRVAERLREATARCEFPGQETQPGGRLTISLGGAAFPADALVARDLVEKADKALFRAKSLGRNRVEWSGGQASIGPIDA